MDSQNADNYVAHVVRLVTNSSKRRHSHSNIAVIMFRKKTRVGA